MSFESIEETGKKIFAKFPKTRRIMKKMYQFGMYSISKKGQKVIGNVVRVSPNDAEYFFGYYDKSPWDASDRYMISLRVKKAYKTPDSMEESQVVVFDTKNDNEMIIIGTTHCWNSQQGCMAQWLGPDFKTKIIYNDFRDGRYVSVIYNFLEKKEEQVLPMPIYDVAKDGTFALTLDFSRLHRLRKGYGYANIPEKNKNILCPKDTCVWKVDLKDGHISEVIKYTDLSTFESRVEMAGAEHKVNHIMISPNGKRFMILHRWFKNNEKFTRLVTLNVDGTDMYNLSDDNFASHCCWKNDKEILSFLQKKESGKHYYLMKDKTKEYKMMWPELNTDGHCTYSPDGEYVITDTYPNRKRIAGVYLCEEKNNTIESIAKVFSPFKYDNDVRCDLHPRWNHNSNAICIDSVHEGSKQLYIINISDVLEEKRKTPKKNDVVVLLASFNGEKYIKEQLDSLLNQEDVDVNILIRDDGSSDNTTNILDEYAKEYSNIHWYTGEHLDVQKSFLDLLKKSPDASYYAFCDQDDVWDKNKLKIAITEIERQENNNIPLLYYSGQRLVDSELNFISNHFIDSKRNNYTNYLISNVAGCTMVFNRCLRELAIQKNPEYILMHDSWLLKLCLSVGGIIMPDERPHISYRQHQNNTVGLKKGLKSKVIQVKRYLYVFEIQKQISELYNNYKSKMTEDYKEFSEEIINYKNAPIKFLKKCKARKVNFNNKSLNIVFIIKVLMRKL